MTRSTMACLTAICLISSIFVLCIPLVSASENIRSSPTPIVQNPLFDQETFKDLMESAIARQDQYLATNPLIENDSVDLSENFTGFFVNNLTASKDQEKFEVPLDGIIQHGIDGKTRVYSSDGKELYYVVDSKSEGVRTPSGQLILASHSIGVPSSAVINLQNNKTYVFSEGMLLVTVIDENPIMTKNAIVNLPAQSDSPSWVEWAESNTAQYFGRFESHWIIPYSPDLSGANPPYSSNILFNGISSTDPRLQFIAQPVTAFNYRDNCKYQNDTGSPNPNCNYQNIWTGSAWFVYNGNSAFHSYPPIAVYEGETVVGRTYTFTDIYGYDYLVNLFAQSDSSRSAAIYFFTNSFPSSPSYYQAVNTYEAWPAFDSNPGYCHTTPCFPDAWKISDATFSGNYADQMNGNSIPLSWVPRINTVGHPEISGLNVDISQAPSTVTLITSDYRTKIGVFRNSTHMYYQDYNGNGAWEGAVIDRAYNFGIVGDLPVSGDWNNDGRTEIGVFRPSTHMFYLDYNGDGASSGPVVDREYNFGITGDLPVSGDWNGGGISAIGVFRPSTHIFYLDYNGNGLWEGAVIDRSYNLGLTGDIPVSGDWNVDGRTEIGVFRPSTHMFYLDYNGNGAWEGAVIDRSYNFGITGDIPVSGDWNGNGISAIGVFRPSTHMFYLDYNGNGAWEGAVIDRSYNFGITGDSPVSGKWN